MWIGVWVVFSIVTISVAAVVVLLLGALGLYLHQHMRVRRHLNRLRLPMDRWNRV